MVSFRFYKIFESQVNQIEKTVLFHFIWVSSEGKKTSGMCEAPLRI